MLTEAWSLKPTWKTHMEVTFPDHVFCDTAYFRPVVILNNADRQTDIDNSPNLVDLSWPVINNVCRESAIPYSCITLILASYI